MPTKRRVMLISGKRKTAVARAVFETGQGRVRINDVPLELYKPELFRIKLMEPLQLSGDLWKSVNIDVNVSGGGFMGQTDAARMAIARGLVKWSKSSEIKHIFDEYDRTMIAGDSRRKEPKKVGGPGARRKKQKSYR